MVYSTTKGESDSLRTMSGGLMKTDGDKLPPGPDGLCITSDSINNNCLFTGDERAAEQPGLTSLHTIFVREHNRLANALAPIFLDDEIIFQEARRINIAQFQHIVYNEFLPAAIGQADVDYFNMNVWPAGYYHETYNIGVDATIRNEFAGAIMRFGHSLINGNIGSTEVDDETLIQERNLEDTFFRPDFYHGNFHSGTDNILKYTTDTASLKSDRGRDHGIPSYNAFRNYCWLPVATCFEPGVGGFVDHDEAVIDLLKLMYTDPNDVDLFTGFLSENRLSGSQLGPTGQCLFIEQLKALRDGDRFFYERPIYEFRSQGFTIGQLNEIKTVTMAKLFCLNTAQASGKRVPSNMFFQQGPGNDYLDCSNVNGINVNYWNY